jgi:hypothetical protein
MLCVRSASLSFAKTRYALAHPSPADLFERGPHCHPANPEAPSRDPCGIAISRKTRNVSLALAPSSGKTSSSSACQYANFFAAKISGR